MRTRHVIAVALLIIPIMFVLLWHLSNNGLPSDDAANYAETALRIARQFRQGPLAGLTAIFDTRGWRPTIFSALAVPFLLLTDGDVVAACAATLISLYVALIFYLYRLARLFVADPLVAGAVTSAVLSMPVVISYSLVFFSESAWVLFSVACTYHLFRSGPFRKIGHALAAGLFGGLMGTVRPVESAIILTVLVGCLIVLEIRSKRLATRNSLMVIGVFLLPASLLVLSGWIQGITRAYIWGLLIATITIAALLRRHLDRALVAFLGALTAVACIWWGGFMPGLLAWAREASAYVSVTRVNKAGASYQFAETILMQVRDYGAVQLAVLAGLVVLLLGSAFVRTDRNNKEGRRQVNNAPEWLLLYASSAMLLIFVALYSIAGSDRRRSLVALTLFASALMLIAASRMRLVRAGLFCLIAVQYIVIGSAIMGSPLWSGANASGIAVPRHAPDENVEAARILAGYVPQGNTVAVYTLALFSPQDRVYEPNALRVALLQGEYGVSAGYFWDMELYDKTIARMEQDGIKYLLLDSFSTVNSSGEREPYAHFITDLFHRLQNQRDSSRLRVITRLQLGGREHTLFRIVPEIAASDNPAADWNGSRGVATEQQKGFPISNINDGTDSAWGSLEGNSNVYAGVVLPSPLAIRALKLRLMTLDGRAHLRNIRVVVADGEDPGGPRWQFVRSRLTGTKDFAPVLTIPALPDNSVVVVEIDQKDPHWRSHLIWGIACLRSEGDIPNYVSNGSGVYLRELELVGQ